VEGDEEGISQNAREKRGAVWKWWNSRCARGPGQENVAIGTKRLCPGMDESSSFAATRQSGTRSTNPGSAHPLDSTLNIFSLSFLS
jgi:hypothetical protein